MTTCKNCNTAFEGKHCPECGQKADTHRFTVGHIAHEVFHAVTHTDKGILFLIKELTYRPGYVAREYNAGKRKKYFSPFTFLLISVAFQIFVLTQTNFYEHFTNATKNMTAQISALAGKPPVQVSADLDKATDDSMAVVKEYAKTLTFVFIPFVALLSWLFFRKSGHNYAENLVIQTLISGQNSLFFLVIAMLFLLNHSLFILVLILSFMIQVVYNLVAYKQFFQQSWGNTIWKVLVLQIIYLTFTNLIVSSFLRIL